MIKLYTIGFTKKSAEKFFNLLINNHLKKIVDVRINNISQLSGFAKAEDLKYFAKTIGNIEYTHLVDFAPTAELLSKYQKKEISWLEYENKYLELLNQRRIITRFNIAEFNDCCFLCSEDTPERCHRRLLVEYLKNNNSDNEDIFIKHLF